MKVRWREGNNNVGERMLAGGEEGGRRLCV